MAKARRSMIRKNMLMDQRKLNAAKSELGVDTETAAVDAALDMVVFRNEVIHGLELLRDAGGLEPFNAPRRRRR